jgi:hypothetical protein
MGFGGLVVGFIIPEEAESESVKEVRPKSGSKEKGRYNDSEPEEKTEGNNETARQKCSRQKSGP